MADKLDTYELGNGMVVLGEPIKGVESAAFDFMIPAGAARLPEGCCGGANVIEDWIFRGAGERDSRALSDAMDGLGLHRSSSVGSSYITVGSALESGNLAAALELYADVILRARLTDEQFEPARQLTIDGVKGLDDDPRQKVMLTLREQFYPQPLGRSKMGHIDDLEKLTAEETRELVRRHFNVEETIFAVAGKYDFGEVRGQIEDLFGEVAAKGGSEMPVGERGDRYTHLQSDGAQVHIGLMTETVLAGDEDYYNARVAVAVLSGSMSSRLFTEVREKRGLCYAVGARYHSLKEAAGIGCYAGTTPDKAQETIDVIRGEFGRLGEGMSEEEIQRAKVGLKSALIMQSESSSARASAIGSDWYVLGRVRSLDEIKEKVEGTSVESLVDFLRRRPFGEFTVVTIGPKEVKV
jgi:predicted Zn-dependent peptidase